MTTMEVSLRSIPDTEATLGRAGSHTVAVDLPDGRAGGQGLGFNGGQMLGLAIGGCLCNDLYYVADDLGVQLTSVAVDVRVMFEGSPLIATSANVEVRITAADPRADLNALVRRARSISTVSNSLARGIPVSVSSAK